MLKEIMIYPSASIQSVGQSLELFNTRVLLKMITEQLALTYEAKAKHLQQNQSDAGNSPEVTKYTDKCIELCQNTIPYLTLIQPNLAQIDLI